jgi:hypothetical protein
MGSTAVFNKQQGPIFFVDEGRVARNATER